MTSSTSSAWPVRSGRQEAGTTWSGSQLLNGPEPSIADDYQWPGMLILDGKPHVFAARHVSGADNDDYRLIRLAP